MAYVDGALLVAGLSNEEFSSKLRRIPFPFGDEVTANNLEIFHVSHGKWETAAPIRTFVPYDGGRSILASYTCTPVVHFPLADLHAGHQGRRPHGRRARRHEPAPRHGRRSCRTARSTCSSPTRAHGLIKIACRDIDAQAPLTEPKEPIGVPRETEDLAGHHPPGQPQRQPRAGPPERRRAADSTCAR